MCICPNVNIQICLSFQFANLLKVARVRRETFLSAVKMTAGFLGEKLPLSYLDVPHGLSGLLKHPRTVC